MSGPYFESGYIDANYFEGDGVTQSADATLTSSTSITVSGSITRQGDSTLTVNATHSTEIQRNRFATVSITDAFNATVSVSISKNLFSTLDSQFDWSVTASRIAGNQSTLDSIITLSLQGDRFRNTEISLLSSFTQSTQIQRIITAQSTHNAEFTISVTANKILTAQSDQSSAVTVTAQIDKISGGQSNVTVTSTVTVTVEKLLSGASTLNSNTTLTVDIAKIVNATVALSDAFTSTLTVTVTKNHTADFNTAFNITILPNKINGFAVSITAVGSITADIVRLRSHTAAFTAETTLTVQTDRIRSNNVSIQSSANLIADIGKIVQISAAINSAFEPTLTVSVFRNHTADLHSAFSISVQADKIGDNTISLNSAFSITATADRIRSTLITVESISSLNGVISRIRPLNFAGSSEFTVQGTAYRIQQFEVTLNAVFAPTLSVTVLRNHTVAISSAFGIEITTSLIRTVTVNVNTAVSTDCVNDRIRSITVTNIDVITTQTILVNKIVATQCDFNSTVTVNSEVGVVKQFNIDLNNAVTAVLTVSVNRSNTVSLASAFEITVTASRTVGIQSDQTVTTTVQIDYTRLRLLNQGISAESTLNITVSKIRSFEIAITDAFNATLTLIILRGVNVTLNSNFTITVNAGRLFKTGQIIDIGGFTPSTSTQRVTGTYNNVSVTGGSGTGAVFNFTVNNTRFISVYTIVNAGSEYRKSDVLTIPTGRLGAGSVATTFTVLQVNDITCASAFTVSATAVDTNVFSAAFNSTTNITVNAERIRGYDANCAVSTNLVTQNDKIVSASVSVQSDCTVTITYGLIKSTDSNITVSCATDITYTRLRLLNQGIGAEFNITVNVIKIKQFTVSLSGVFTPTLNVTVFRNHTADLNDAFILTAQISRITTVESVLNFECTQTAVVTVLKQLDAQITSQFTQSTQINATLSFNGNSNLTLNSAITLTALIGKVLLGSAQFTVRSHISRLKFYGANINNAYSLLGSGVLTLANNAHVEITDMPQIGTGDFTLELLVRRTNAIASGTPEFIFDGSQTDATINNTSLDGPWLYIGDDDEIKYNNTYFNDGTDQITSGDGNDRFLQNQTHHLAVVRHNGVTKLFRDGVQKGVNLSDTMNWTATTWTLGNIALIPDLGFTGYVDELRVSRVAKYTSGNFGNIYSVNPTEFTEDADTVILCHFNLTNNPDTLLVTRIKSFAVNIQSRSSKLIVEGGVSISAVDPKFGNGSVQFDGVDDRVIAVDRTPLSTGNFTIELWFKRGNVQNDSTVMTLLEMFSSQTLNNQLAININTNEQVQYVVAGDVKIQSQRIFDNTNWHQITVIRQNSVTKMWLDTVQVGDAYFDTNNITADLYHIGNNSNLTAPYTGYLDELSVSNVSRNPDAFNYNLTLNPSAQFLNTQNNQFYQDGNNILLLHFNGSQIELPLIEISTVIRPATVNVNSAFSLQATVNPEFLIIVTQSTQFVVTVQITKTTRGTAVLTANSQLIVVSNYLRLMSAAVNTITTVDADADIVQDFSAQLVSTAQCAVTVNRVAHVQTQITAVSALQYGLIFRRTSFRTQDLPLTLTAFDQSTVGVTPAAIKQGDIPMSVLCSATATATRIKPFEVSAQAQAQITVTVNLTGSAQSSITVQNNLVVIIGSVKQFNITLTVLGSESSAVAMVGTFFINMNSAFAQSATDNRIRGLNAVMGVQCAINCEALRIQPFTVNAISESTLTVIISQTKSFISTVNAQAQISTTVTRIFAGTVTITATTTQTVTAHTTARGHSDLNSICSITVIPQPLDQILTVVRMTVMVSVTTQVREMFLNDNVLYIRNENRIYTINNEVRQRSIRTENRVYTIRSI